MTKKLKMVQFYKSVPMGNGQITSAAPSEMYSDKIQDKGYEISIKEQGVEVSDAKMTCFVPWSNVSTVQYLHVDEPAKPTKAK